LPVSITSSWFGTSSQSYVVTHLLVIRLNANTLMPLWQATITSWTVLIPVGTERHGDLNWIKNVKLGKHVRNWNLLQHLQKYSSADTNMSNNMSHNNTQETFINWEAHMNWLIVVNLQHVVGPYPDTLYSLIYFRGTHTRLSSVLRQPNYSFVPSQ
jgi:hypothetical protein